MDKQTYYMLLYYLVAFFTAAVVTWCNVYSNVRFNSYFFLFYRHWTIIMYAGIYGTMGLLLYVLCRPGVISIEASNLKSGPEVLLAAATGISTKGIADVSLFSIKHGNEQVPVGIRTFSRFLDTFFEDIFDKVCYARIAGFCDEDVRRLSSLKIHQLKQCVVKELSAYPGKGKVVSYAQAVKNVATHKEVLDCLLCFFGKATYRKICSRILV